jgi:sialate O-acetylesterase
MRALVLTTLLIGSPALGQTAFDAPFTDHAVLQRGRPIPVHGTGTPLTRVAITLGDSRLSTIVDRTGHWRAVLPARVAGGPYRLEARTARDATMLSDIMIGDVWLCSGQSNMEFTLRHATNADGEVAQSGHPLLRLFNVPRQSSPAAMTRFAQPVAWQVSSPASAGDFSAACWIMGRDLQQRQGIAVGLIAASWGGSVIEDWISAGALGRLARYRPDLDLLAQYERSPDTARTEVTTRIARWLSDRVGPAPARGWNAVPDPVPWENWGGRWKDFDGTAFYRTTVHLAPADIGPARLTLGKIDDVDVTSVNGRLVGATLGWDSERGYAVPAAQLRAGDNVIEVAAIDTGGGGGMWGDPSARTLVLASGRTVPLGRWEVAAGPALARTGAPPPAPWIGGSGRTSLFNGMIAPLGDYPLTGFAWYQGEANVNDWTGYAELMPLLIADWRGRFGAKPFLMVQLAGYGPLAESPIDHPWARLRDVQRRVADADPQVGLASALDVGQVADIHPTDKQTVGRRLALAARAIALGDTVEARGPSPSGVTRSDEGIVVQFAHGPLVQVAGDGVLGFELCGQDGRCRFVPGRVASKNTVVLPPDPQAVEVRYLWQASPFVNLYNPAGQPATGFALAIRRP